MCKALCFAEVVIKPEKQINKQSFVKSILYKWPLSDIFPNLDFMTSFK